MTDTLVGGLLFATTQLLHGVLRVAKHNSSRCYGFQWAAVMALMW